jgi:hypothetical protein
MSLLRPSEGFPQRADPAPSCVGTRLSLSLRSVAVSNVFSAITIARKRVFGLSSLPYVGAIISLARLADSSKKQEKKKSFLMPNKLFFAIFKDKLSIPSASISIVKIAKRFGFFPFGGKNKRALTMNIFSMNGGIRKVDNDKMWFFFIIFTKK